MPRVGFQPTIPTFEQAKTVHALDREATVIGFCQVLLLRKKGLLIISFLCINMKGDYYEELQLLIVMAFLKIPRLVFKVVTSEFIISY
jgi:hypothetical protein